MENIYQLLASLEADNTAAVVVTVVAKTGHGPAQLQSKMVVADGGRLAGSVGGGALEQTAIAHAGELLIMRQPDLVHYNLTTEHQLIGAEETGMVCGGTVSLYYEYLGVRQPLYLIGAGHINRQLARVLQGCGFYMIAVDDRPDVLEEIEGVQERRLTAFGSMLVDDGMPSNAFAVIATYSHDEDFNALKQIYASGWKPHYIGMVASRGKKKTKLPQMIEELGAEPDLSTFYAPAGLRVGGSTPAEIAVSIAAEIQAIRYDKQGNIHLRDKGK